MKKSLLIVLLCAFLSSYGFSQSADFVQNVVNSSEVTYKQVAYLVSVDLGLISETQTEEDSIVALNQKFPQFEKNYSADKVISIKDFSYISSIAYNQKTSLLFIIFKTPRYALKQMKANRYFEITENPSDTISGRKVLEILADISNKTVITE